MERRGSQRRTPNELNGQLHAMGLKKADVVALARLTGEPLDVAALSLCAMSLDGRRIEQTRGDAVWDEPSRRLRKGSRIAAATELLKLKITNK